MIEFTPTDACKEEYPKPQPPATKKGDNPTDTSKLTPVFSSEPLVIPKENYNVAAAVGTLAGLFVAFIIFLICIRWDNGRVSNIRSRERSDKDKGADEEVAHTARPLNN